MRLMAKVINMLNFIVIDLQLYKIFKITRVSFFGHTLYMYIFWDILRRIMAYPGL